jgi:predicted dehydrogenase
MKQLLDEGQLGQLHYIDSVRINLGRIQSDVNVVWDLAPHDLSIVDYLVGRLPLTVGAFGATHTEQGLEDVAYINLDYGDGIIANFHVNWLSPVKIRYTIVGGSDRSIVFNDLHPAEIVKVFDSGVIVQRDDLKDRRRLLVDYRTGDIWSPYVPHVEPLGNVTGEFLDRIENGTGSLTDGEAGLRVVTLLEAIDRIIQENGSRVTVSQPTTSAPAAPPVAAPVPIDAAPATPGQPS